MEIKKRVQYINIFPDRLNKELAADALLKLCSVKE